MGAFRGDVHRKRDDHLLTQTFALSSLQRRPRDTSRGRFALRGRSVLRLPTLAISLYGLTGRKVHTNQVR